MGRPWSERGFRGQPRLARSPIERPETNLFRLLPDESAHQISNAFIRVFDPARQPGLFPAMTRNLAASRAGDSDNIEKIVMMNELASSRTRGSSGPGWAVTVYRQAGLRLLFVSLLVALAAVGCRGGQGDVGGKGPVKDANIGGDEGPGEDADVVVMFPQHDAPLGTDNGGNYHAGRLVLNEGCLRIEVPPDANGPGRASLLIWPSGFALNVERGVVRIVDSDGEIAASVGDHIRLSRATVSYQEATDQGLLRGMSEDCAGSFIWLETRLLCSTPTTNQQNCSCQTRISSLPGGRP